MATEERQPLSSTPDDSPQVSSQTPPPDFFDPINLHEPKPSFMSPGGLTPRNSSLRDSYAQPGTPSESGLLLPTKEFVTPSGDELEPNTTRVLAEQPVRKRRYLLALIALLIVIVLAVAIVVPVYFTVIKPKNNTAVSPTASSTGAAAPTTSSHSKPPSAKGGISGSDGSTITATNGTTFTYNNKFGGIWYYNPNDPYSDSAYPNSWTPPLNQTWDFSANRIYGVNIGGWFVLEPFISPQLYQKYPAATDEWSISTLMAADTASGGLSQLEHHYQTFITEDDFAEMAGAGLNWVRIPIPYWAIDVFDGEPFLAKTCWKYILQALQWSRKYGLRVKMDLHTAPGSQNGYNHSGKGGQINFLRGTMGLANAQRMLNYIRIFTEFFSQPEWKNLIIIFGVVNEPIMGSIGEDQLKAFNYEAYQVVRNVTGIGAGNGPYVSYHDSFQPMTTWAGSLTGADRVILDSHPYFAFDDPAATDAIDTGTGPTAGGPWPAKACDRWASEFNTSRTGFGVTIAGEWSVALNDCGLFVKGTSLTSNFANCAQFQDSSTWSDGTKAGLMRVAMASMDATRDWFFWTWKVAPSQAGIVEAPFWSYQLGLRGGWIPKDPRTALGTCASTGPVFGGQYESWMTGGSGAGVMQTTFPWPPVSLNLAPADPTGLPTYTTTGAIHTLPVPTYTDTSGKTIASGNGWFNANDNTLAPTPISGCTYPDPWDALSAAVPAGCGFAAAGAVGVVSTRSGTSRTSTTTGITTTSTTTGTTTTPATTTII